MAMRAKESTRSLGALEMTSSLRGKATVPAGAVQGFSHTQSVLYQ